MCPKAGARRRRKDRVYIPRQRFELVNEAGEEIHTEGDANI